MLNFIYWPISAVLWFWHWLLSFVLDSAWGGTWIIAIVLLTWTLKAIMVADHHAVAILPQDAGDPAANPGAAH